MRTIHRPLVLSKRSFEDYYKLGQLRRLSVDMFRDRLLPSLKFQELCNDFRRDHRSSCYSASEGQTNHHHTTFRVKTVIADSYTSRKASPSRLTSNYFFGSASEKFTFFEDYRHILLVAHAFKIFGMLGRKSSTSEAIISPYFPIFFHSS